MALLQNVHFDSVEVVHCDRIQLQFDLRHQWVTGTIFSGVRELFGTLPHFDLLLAHLSAAELFFLFFMVTSEVAGFVGLMLKSTTFGESRVYGLRVAIVLTSLTFVTTEGYFLFNLNVLEVLEETVVNTDNGRHLGDLHSLDLSQDIYLHFPGTFHGRYDSFQIRIFFFDLHRALRGLRFSER